MNWIRLAIYAAMVAAAVAVAAAVRAHWIGVGEARVQARWDLQKKADADLALQLHAKRASEQDLINRNAERTAHEDHRREQARLQRLADAQRTVDGLRDAIAKLDADDLSAAAADPRVAAIAERAIAGRRLLARCAARHTELAGRAQRIRDQAAGLQDFALNVCGAGAAE